MLIRMMSGVLSSMRFGEKPVESSRTFRCELSRNSLSKCSDLALYNVNSYARSDATAGQDLTRPEAW